MPLPPARHRLSTADKLRRCADDMYRAADLFERDSRSTQFSDQRTGEVERILDDARAAVRGRG